MINELDNAFEHIFNAKPETRYFSPGRVNLIGEHTDYSGGRVFPMALSLGIHGVVRRRDDSRIRAYSETFKRQGVLEIDQADLAFKKDFSFGNYIQGVLAMLNDEGFKTPSGFDLYMHSTLPASAGLSSSAALEMLLFEIIKDINNLDIGAEKTVRMAKRVENDYMGVSSGIMDQFAVKFGKKNHALFLDTKTLKYEHAPIDLENHTLLLMNTNKKRDLVESDYNERFNSVKAGFEALAAQFNIETLCDLEEKDLAKAKAIIKDETVIKRITHVIEEDTRTIQALFALKDGDYPLFGSLMDKSHASLRDLFEVSCDELDFLVAENKRRGALGARMTGAGFGGTMIAFYRQSQRPDDLDLLKNDYQNRFGRPLDIYEAVSADGAGRRKEES